MQEGQHKAQAQLTVRHKGVTYAVHSGANRAGGWAARCATQAKNLSYTMPCMQTTYPGSIITPCHAYQEP
eukprot:1159074-Pelagomonas_calceolata.AAC.7